jgi:hypothetical protein
LPLRRYEKKDDSNQKIIWIEAREEKRKKLLFDLARDEKRTKHYNREENSKLKIMKIKNEIEESQ